MGDQTTAKRKVFKVRLTKMELLHLRDLFNIILPPTMTTTISQALARSTDRSLVESRLWQKIAEACREAELPMDEEAPDFTVAVSGAPSIDVFELAHEPASLPAATEHSLNVFPDSDDDEEKEPEEKACGNCGTLHKTEKQKKRCFGKVER